MPVAILANLGILFSESALKVAHFIELASQRGVPLLFLQNIPGFMVVKQSEHDGIAKDRSTLVHPVTNPSVPNITVGIGATYVPCTHGWAERAYHPRLCSLWSHSRIHRSCSLQAATSHQQ